MDFQLSEFQVTVETAISQIAAPFRAAPMHHGDFYVAGAALDAELARSGFHDVVADEDLGEVTAALVVMEIARLPLCVEIAASVLVRPLVCPDAPRPLALIDRPDRPVRFLPQAEAALIVTDTGLGLLAVAAGDVEPVQSLFAYPYGRLAPGAAARAVPIEADPERLRRLWRIGLAAEICGALDSGLALTVDYVTQRHQFGRAIGSFQAVQHRLSEVAVLMHATRWLTLRAASSGAAEDAALACAYAQDAARVAAHELHQFTGAIGLTLEHPLHLWTYRLKALVSELGGAGGQSAALAELTWGAAA